MKISTEFSKYANEYNKHNIIQNYVVEKLVSEISTKPQNILDLGCGNGALCMKIDWDFRHFVGVDFALGMLELHPKSKNIECIYGDFNDVTLFDNLRRYSFDYIFSASALQWAENLDHTFAEIKSLDAPVALAIFTSNTFKTLNKTAAIRSLLATPQKINKIQKKYFDASFEVVNYTLEFESTREIFQYIKRSGVSGARNILTFKETKELLKKYPTKSLEFEVAYIISR